MAKNQGIRSKNVKEVGYRGGQQKKRVLPAGAAQLGQRQGNHITEKGYTQYGGADLFKGTGYKSELGNSAALNCSGNKAGPGCDRNVYKSGTVGTYGATNPGNPKPVDKTSWPYGK